MTARQDLEAALPGDMSDRDRGELVEALHNLARLEPEQEVRPMTDAAPDATPTPDEALADVERRLAALAEREAEIDRRQEEIAQRLAELDSAEQTTRLEAARAAAEEAESRTGDQLRRIARDREKLHAERRELEAERPALGSVRAEIEAELTDRRFEVARERAEPLRRRELALWNQAGSRYCDLALVYKRLVDTVAELERVVDEAGPQPDDRVRELVGSTPLPSAWTAFLEALVVCHHPAFRDFDFARRFRELAGLGRLDVPDPHKPVPLWALRAWPGLRRL